MFQRIIILATLMGLLVWSCSGNSPTGGGDQQIEIDPLGGGGRLAADDPIDGRDQWDTFGVDRDPMPPMHPDTIGANWRILFAHQVDCAEDPGEEIIVDSASWHEWWDEAHACLWNHDTTRSDTGWGFPGGPDTVGRPAGWEHRYDRPDHPGFHGADTLWPDSNWGHPGTDTTWHDTIPPDWHGNPWTDSSRFDPPQVDFSHYIVAAIRVEYDSGAFCMRRVNFAGAGMDGSEFVIEYDVTRLEGDCCGRIMAPIIEGAGSPVVAVMIEKPSTSSYRFDRANVEYDCWLPDPDEPITLSYTRQPCNAVQNEQLITDSDTWERWFADVYGCDTIAVRRPGVDTTAWGDSTGGRPYDTAWASRPAPQVDFSRHAVIILSSSAQMNWGGGIWLTEFSNGDAGAIVEYSVMEPSSNCPSMDDSSTHMSHTTAIRVTRPTNDHVTWRRSVRTIDCNWEIDTTLVDSL